MRGEKKKKPPFKHVKFRLVTILFDEEKIQSFKTGQEKKKIFFLHKKNKYCSTQINALKAEPEHRLRDRTKLPPYTPKFR